MEQLNKQSVEAACLAAGMEVPPAQRYRIRQYTSASKIHPCDRKRYDQPTPKRILIDADIPLVSGVYFFWRESLPFYVGQAIRLQQRLIAHAMKKYCDEVAWVFCPQEDLSISESFYIGILRPMANFGTIKQVRCDQDETYWDEERIGELVLKRGPTYRRPIELPLPPGAVIRFPGRAS